MTGRSPLKATENVIKSDEDLPGKKAVNPYGPDYPKGKAGENDFTSFAFLLLISCSSVERNM